MGFASVHLLCEINKDGGARLPAVDGRSRPSTRTDFGDETETTEPTTLLVGPTLGDISRVAVVRAASVSAVDDYWTGTDRSERRTLVGEERISKSNATDGGSTARTASRRCMHDDRGNDGGDTHQSRLVGCRGSLVSAATDDTCRSQSGRSPVSSTKPVIRFAVHTRVGTLSPQYVSSEQV